MTVVVVSKRANLSTPPAFFLQRQIRQHQHLQSVRFDTTGHLHFVQNPEHILVKPHVSLRHGLHLLRKPLVKCLGHLLRLADAAALDDDVVEVLELRKADELLEEVAAEGAADAAVLEGDDLFLGLGEAVGLLD